MRKKFTAFVIGGLIAGSMLLPLSACGDKNQDKTSEWDTHVTINSAGANVSWDKVNGAKSYNIYHSPSRFGTYTLVSNQTKLTYTNADSYGYYRVEAVDKSGEVISSELYSYEIDTFGGNTRIYAETDDQELVQADVDAFRDATGQFYEGRYAGLFKEGEYNDLDLQMRYYMTFSGLGYLPTDTEIGGFFTNGELKGGNATCNFWCGINNMTVNSNVRWAVSQATSFRRMQVNGNLTLYDHRFEGTETNTPWCSGGYISDTTVTGTINASYQQQWFTRNSEWGTWKGCDINMVFSGCAGAFENKNYVWPSKRVTTLETTNVMREKPYLVFDGGYFVCRPELQKNSSGTTWKNGDGINDNDEYIPLNKFYVARSDRDTAETLNAALKSGKHILLTPGIYDIDSPILVENSDTVILGLGLASLRLTDKNTDTIMRISDVDGVQLSGIMFEAGPYSKTLLQIGTQKNSVRHNENPVILNDVYYRIGGAGSIATSVDTTLEINSNDVVGDNFWVWRADHGNTGTVGWDINRTKNGVIVNGDYVTIYGLMVEHFHEYQTIWNGEYGFMAFYQSETPYDVPTQAEDGSQEAWMSEWNGVRYEGYASYKVSDSVINHTAYGIGVYYVASSRLKNVFNLDHAIELPANAGIHAEHMAIANFAQYGDKKTNGGIRHIVNDKGHGSFDGTKYQFTSYIAGLYKE